MTGDGELCGQDSGWYLGAEFEVRDTSGREGAWTRIQQSTTTERDASILRSVTAHSSS